MRFHSVNDSQKWRRTPFCGLHFHIDTDECALNDELCGTGTCENMPGSYRCQCLDGFTGRHCETGNGYKLTIARQEVKRQNEQNKTNRRVRQNQNYTMCFICYFASCLFIFLATFLC